MTTVLERKIYDLVTKPENFEIAFEIHEKFDGIKERLQDDFWIKFIKKVKDSFNEMVIDYDENQDETTIYLTPKKDYKNRYQSYYFWFMDNPLIVQMGLGFDEKCNSKAKFESICEKYYDLNTNFKNFTFKEDREDTWLYRNFDEDLNSFHGLRKILPENRNELIDEYIKVMQLFIEDTIIEVDKIEKMFA